MGDEDLGGEIVVAGDARIEDLIYTVRGMQVMLDSDLARLYEVETKYLNRVAGRNSERFPDDFRLKLTRAETDVLRCQIGTLAGQGPEIGRTYLPYAYTEQGIAMLAGLLRSDVAVRTSIAIMRAFVAMRHFIAGTGDLYARVRELDRRQAVFEHETDARFDEIFGLLEAHEEPRQHVFFDGQMFDALELLAGIVGKAEREVVLVDGYVDLATLGILAKKRPGVAATVWTTSRGDRLAPHDVEAFNAQHPTLEVRHTDAFHDRFLVLDDKAGYHIGASIKDAGKKCFAVSLIEDEGMVGSLLGRLAAL